MAKTVIQYTQETFGNVDRDRYILSSYEDLKSSGRINHGFTLSVGDTIQFPKNWADTIYDHFMVKGVYKAFRLGVCYNGKPTMMPTGSIRRMPYEWKEAFKGDKFAVNRQLLEYETDYERIEAFHDKTLKVVEVIDLDTTVFDENTKRSKVDEEGKIVLVKNKYPVFEIVND